MKAKVWRLYGAKDIVMSIAALLAGVVIANEGDGAIPVVAEKAGPIEVRVDPNFELIAMVCHLAGYEEYALSLHKEKDRKLIKDRFGSLTNHPAVKAFKNYRKKAGISYDAPASLSVHLKPDLSGYLVPLDPWPQRLDTRWKKIDLEEVRRQLVDFRSASRFDEWYVARAEANRTIVGEAIKKISDMHLPEWLGRYYGPQKRRMSLRVVLSLMTSGGNYGCSIDLSDEETLYTPIVGHSEWGIVQVLPHEFSHPFNRAPDRRILREVERKSPQALAGLKKEFEKVKGKMSRQSYGNFHTWWGETFNRANELRYFRSYLPEYEDRSTKYVVVKFTDMVMYRLESFEARGFALVRPLYNLLDKYEADRKKYKTLDDFVPVIVDFLVERYSNEGREDSRHHARHHLPQREEGEKR